MVYSVFNRAVWYTPTSERQSAKPVSFLLQPPTYKLFSEIGNTQELPDGVAFLSVDTLLLQHCILDTLNIEGYTEPNDLPLELQKEIIEAILELFYPTKEFMDTLEFNLNASMDDKFSNETWSCEKCQEKRLNRQRNCPFLDPEEYHEASYSITIGNTSYSICPMDKRDFALLHMAFEAYKITEAGFLPFSGGYAEQPLLFCLLAQRVKEKVNYYERKQLEESRAKTQH